MDEQEIRFICNSYREAKNKNKQIGILVQLTLLNRNKIKAILQENGLEVAEIKNNYARIPIEIKEKAIKMRKNGMKIREINEQLNVSHKTVENWLKEHAECLQG